MSPDDGFHDSVDYLAAMMIVFHWMKQGISSHRPRSKGGAD
jgi:hypothetical protein